MSPNPSKRLTQKDAFKHFMEQLDIEMIDDILDNDLKYQNFSKQDFIRQMGDLFERFKNHGDTCLISIPGTCMSCDKSKGGFAFVGNKSRNYFNLIVDSKEGKINDLYECTNFLKQKRKLGLRRQLKLDIGNNDNRILPF